MVKGSRLFLNGKPITVFQKTDISSIPWSKSGAKYIVETTGVGGERELKAHLSAGAYRVLAAHPAPFSYLTLYCPIVNENCGPKQVTHHIFYSVQKIAVVQRKKRVILTLPHRISNPKSLISLQPTKAFMRLS